MDKNKKLYIAAFTASLFGILCFASLALAARYLLIISDMSWQYLHAVMGLVLGMVLLIIIMVFGWILVLNRSRNKKNQINFVENLWVSKDKWLHKAVFIAGIFGTLGIVFGAISSWKIVYESTTESLRFWFALGAFVCFVFVVAVIIMLWCVILFVRNPKHREKIATVFLKIK